jgi:hypothetical protein
MMTAVDHDMRPGCAEDRGKMNARLDNLEGNVRDARIDYKELRGIVTEGFEAVRTDVATLKERARTWGAVGGTISSIVVSIIAGIILFVLLA